MNKLVLAIVVLVISMSWTSQSQAADLTVGCRSRPACGKVCKLVHDTRTLVSICYGCECATICVPGPSQPGCKHCESSCCGCDGCGDGAQSVKCDFCWRDWIACGCATPRTVKVLTKYQAERTIDAYHWEVVESDGCPCVASGFVGGAESGVCLYKPAPPEAELGDTFKLSSDERTQLANSLQTGDQPMAVSLASAVTDVAGAPQAEPQPEGSKPSIWQRMAGALGMAPK